jgi:hypothetical protein
MEKIISHVSKLLFSEKGYSALFKASVALIGFSLLAMSQTMPFFYDKEIAAYKKKYTIEVSTKTPIEKVDCAKIGPQQIDCLVTKHELKTLSSFLDVLDKVVRFSFTLGIIFAGASLLGFVGSAFRTHGDES